jgi:F-type H+-transporting ATPase subunit gamma
VRAREVREWLHDVEALAETVNLLRGIAAAELRGVERVLATARAYRRVAEEVLMITSPWAPPAGTSVDAPPHEPRAGLCVYTSALGMCGDFNRRLLAAADEHAKKRLAAGEPLRVFAIGERAADWFEGRDDVRLLDRLEAPTSADGLPELMGRLVDAIAAAVPDHVDTVSVLGARYDRPGRFEPVTTPLLPPTLPELPVSGTEWGRRSHFYLPPGQVFEHATEELTFGLLYALLAETLASEHGARGVATQRAYDGLDERRRALVRQYRETRQAEITEELLEVAAAAAAVERD